MKFQNIDDVTEFFTEVEKCTGTVELISSEGDRINLKSKLSQYVSIASMCSHGYIEELELVAHEKEDMDRLVEFMLNSKRPEA